MRRSLAYLTVLFVMGPGCADDSLTVDPGDGGHGKFDEVLVSEWNTGTPLATWTADRGWRDADDEVVDQLPPAVAGDGDLLEPLRAGGAPASLRIDMRSEQQSVDLSAATAPGGGSLAPTCGEFSVRYFPLDDDTNVVAWPNQPPESSPEAPAQYAQRQTGDVVAIFHCDRVDVFPEEAGLARLEFLLWHVNHADQASDALTVSVVE